MSDKTIVKVAGALSMADIENAALSAINNMGVAHQIMLPPRMFLCEDMIELIYKPKRWRDDPHFITRVLCLTIYRLGLYENISDLPSTGEIEKFSKRMLNEQSSNKRRHQKVRKNGRLLDKKVGN